MIYIDKCAYTNRLTNVHPLEKILFAVLTIVVCLTSNTYVVPVIILLLMCFMTVFVAGISYKFYFKLMLVPFGFLVLGLISIAINTVQSGDQVIWSIHIFGTDIGLTYQTLNFTSILFVKSLGAISCLYFLSLTTPLVDIMSVLRKFKLPEVYIDLMCLIYRVIFILIGIIGKIYTSQSSRLGYSTIKNQYRSLGQLVTCLFMLAYKKTSSLFIALECRCYTGKLKVLEKDYKICKSNVLFIVFIEAILILVKLMSEKII